MSLKEEEIEKLFMIQETLMQMLNDRGYLVGDFEINMSKEQFISKFGENMTRKDLVFHKSKRNDTSDQIFVFFPTEPKINASVLKRYADRMKSEDVFRAILVIKEYVTPIGRTCIAEMASKFQWEIFQEDELLVNIKEHALVPEHQVLTTEEKKALLERYTVKETQLPRIQFTDPVARYYGLQRGQVVKIIRPSETAGRYVTYRYVI
ncbi:DNA-directed RNA polymerases I II and III subunit RPABC1 [Euphorbia peplus]|nr:DNA-directed RNA polymerases I II and III subunit RPABC1 [Euphorbia peplus]